MPANASVKLLVTNKSSTNITPELRSCRHENALIVKGLATSTPVMDALISETGSIQSVVTALLATERVTTVKTWFGYNFLSAGFWTGTAGDWLKNWPRCAVAKKVVVGDGFEPSKA